MSFSLVLSGNNGPQDQTAILGVPFLVYSSFGQLSVCVKSFLVESLSSVESEHSSTHTHFHSEGKYLPIWHGVETLGL